MEDLVDLLGDNPRLAPDIYFRVFEEQIVDGNIETKIEVVGAHKFVLAMVSDVFRALFFGPTWKNDEEIFITGSTICAVKEFLKILYSLHTSSCETSITDARHLFEILSLFRRYLDQPEITVMEDTILCAVEENISDESDPEDVIAVAVIANEYKDLHGFQAISKTVLKRCSVILNSFFPTVHKARQFLGQVEADFSSETADFVVSLLSLADCDNCKAVRCRHEERVTTENVVMNAQVKAYTEELDQPVEGRITRILSFYSSKTGEPVSNLIEIKDSDVLGFLESTTEVLSLNHDDVYFLCR